MERASFTEEQIITILKEQENGLPTKDVCRKAGIISATFYKPHLTLSDLSLSCFVILVNYDLAYIIPNHLSSHQEWIDGIAIMT